MANQKPVDEIRIGRGKATIWRNDLLVLAKVADLAHTRTFPLPQEEETEAEDES